LENLKGRDHMGSNTIFVFHLHTSVILYYNSTI